MRQYLLTNNSGYTISGACSRRLHKLALVVAMELEPDDEASSIEGERLLSTLIENQIQHYFLYFSIINISNTTVI